MQAFEGAHEAHIAEDDIGRFDAQARAEVMRAGLRRGELGDAVGHDADFVVVNALADTFGFEDFGQCHHRVGALHGLDVLRVLRLIRF